MNAQAQARKASANPNKAENSTTANATTMSMSSIANNTNSIDTNAIKTEITATNCSADDFLQQIQQQQQHQVLQLQGDCQTICLHVNIQTIDLHRMWHIFEPIFDSCCYFVENRNSRYQQVTIQRCRCKSNYHHYWPRAQPMVQRTLWCCIHRRMQFQLPA